MGNEDEEASELSNHSLQVEDESMNATTATAAVAGSREAVQDKTEPQCEPESVDEFSEPQLPSTGEGKEVGEAEVTADGHLGNDEDVVHGGDLVVPAPEVGAGEGVEEDVIGEVEREVDDVAEGKEEKAEQKGDDVAVEAQIECETKVSEVTEVVGGQKGFDDVVAVEAQIENERKVDDVVAEETEIVDERAEIAGEGEVSCDKAEGTETVDERKAIDVAVETDGRVEMADGSEIAGETREVDVAEDKEMEKETNVADLAEETVEERKAVDVAVDNVGNAEMAEDSEIAGETREVDVAGDKEMAKEINVAELAEETVDETKAVHVAVENDGSAGMAEDSVIAGETREVDVAGDKEIAKEINVVGLGKEFTSDEDKVEDVTETTVAAAGDEMEVDDVVEETEKQEEMEFTDVAVGETEVEEGMEKAAEETEMLEAAETEYETEKDGMAEEMETGEDVEEVSKTVGGKRKRAGKNSKSPGKAPSRKKSEEDVCFICFDGGDLVLCDRR